MMTRKQAHAAAHLRWGTNGIARGDRVGFAARHRTSPLYRIGFVVRGGGPLEPSGSVVCGTSDVSWDEAFAISYPCQWCAAGPGDPCINSLDDTVLGEMHEARLASLRTQPAVANAIEPARRNPNNEEG